MRKITGNAKLAKQINRALILQTIRKHAPISRVDLVAKTGLTSGTISNLTNEMLHEGLLTTTGTEASTGGRPRVLLEINSRACLALGVNIGGTKVVSILTDLDGTVLERHDTPLDRTWSVERQLGQIISAIEEVIPTNSLRERIIGIGVGLPGLLDSTRGISVFAPNLGWRDLPIKSILEERFEIPVCIDNAVRVGALGERWWGAGRTARNIVALYVGTGVGAGMILDGKLYRGSQEAAGEIGHVVVAEGGAQCSCGNRGCLEAMASGPAIVRQAYAQLKRGRESLLQNVVQTGRQLTGELVYEAAKQGDALAGEIMHSVAKYIGIGMSIIINLFNPELLVFNGGVSRSWDLIKPTVLATVAERVFASCENVQIVTSELGDSVGALGAATLVIEGLFDNSEAWLSGRTVRA